MEGVQYCGAVLLVFCLQLWTSQGINLTYNIQEELPVGQLVGNVGLDADLDNGMSDEYFQTLKYSILINNKLEGFFTLNQTTGNLYTNTVLDREVICPYETTCAISMEISVSSSKSSFFEKIYTKVFIDDINDNAPVFPKSTVELSILESVLVGTSFTIDGAKDNDRSDMYSLKSYELKPQGIPFSLQFKKNIDGTSILKIVVDGLLDREKQSYYQLEIIARDGGSPPLTDTMIVDVTVEDVNDNAPLLSSSVYNATVKEDINVGTVIFQLSATDIDLGDNARVTYRLSYHQSDEIKELFQMNATTGELVLRQHFPSMREPTYRVIVEASDSGDHPLTTQTLVIVSVQDTGNNPPEIIVSLLNTINSSASLPENAPFGYAVAHFNVIDRDSGYNGIVFCRIDNPVFELISVDVNDYKITLAQQLNREERESHQIKITCQDNGNPSMLKETSFVVLVNDINDNPPVFTHFRYSGSIQENNDIDDIILKVTAGDADSGSNAEVNYMLQESNQTLVAIDRRTGVITAKTVFDREVASSYELGVLAVDGGNPPRVATATVVFTINDENDNPPKFEENLFLFKVKENQQLGTVIGRLFASDKDIGDNAKIVYSLTPRSPSDLPFVIYSDGLIQTKGNLDRELKSMYNFTVMVSDLGRPSLNSTARVNVFLEDENDNSPRILFPSISNNTVSIGAGTPPGSVVAAIVARDPDDGAKGEIEYGFDGYNDTGYFKIFSSSGHVILQQSVQKYAGQAFTLSIVVSDKGKPPRRSLQTLRIVINATSSGNMNVIIVVTLVCVTLVLSAGIILVICVIRRLDANKKSATKRQTLANNTHSSPDHNNQNSLNNCESPLPIVVEEDPQMIDTERKRKEVTFSFSPDQTIPNGYIYENKPNRLGRPVSYRDQVGQTFLKLQDDNHSQTSGETNTSDSGRGLSDDENHAHNGQKLNHSFSKGYQPKPMEINLFSNPGTYVSSTQESISPIDMPRFTAYPPYSQKTRFNFDLGNSFGSHRPLHTFHLSNASTSLDEDSRSTSGIHTMDEEFNVSNRNDSVI